MKVFRVVTKGRANLITADEIKLLIESSLGILDDDLVGVEIQQEASDGQSVIDLDFAARLMAVYKEELRYLDDLASRQVQIYEDAVDVGIEVSGFHDPLLKEIKKLLEEDFPVVGLSDFIQKRQIWGERGRDWGYEVRIRIPWEKDDEFYCGTEVLLSYNEDKSMNVKFVTIGFNEFRSVDNPFKEDREFVME